MGRRRTRYAIGAVTAAVLVGVAVLLAVPGGETRLARVVPGHAQSAQQVNLDPTAIARGRRTLRGSATPAGAHPQVVDAVPPGQAYTPDTQSPVSTRGSARAQSDKDIERELAQFRAYLATIPPTTGKRAEVLTNGEAAAPFQAPQTVIQVVQAANEIARTPYLWGGGHSAWRDKGYDCSGSVSFALAAAGLLSSPLDSTAFMRYGAPGPGRWITIYANHVHAFMTIAGLRFDTGGLGSGTRWQGTMRSTSGFVVRHPPGF